MNLHGIFIDAGTKALLEANGRDDRNRGITMYAGWEEVAKILGLNPFQRTPAREAYEDGYYSGGPDGRPL